MTTPAVPEQIAAAQAYENLFVPALFSQWAPVVAEAAQVGAGQRLLDVGCGTGVLTRELARRAGETGAVTGLDPLPGMLEVARRAAPRVQWTQGTAEALPFPDQSFDAVVSQFALMFMPDRPRVLAEFVRVLAPRGRLALAVWDKVEAMPAYAAEVALLERSAGKAAADALRAPFALGDRTELERLASKAGLADARVHTRTGTATFPSIRVMVEADLRGWLPLMGVPLSEELIGRILREAEDALGDYRTPDGRAQFGLSIHVLTAARG